jgi:N-acetylneuraminic acid mutarotase
MKWLNDYKMRLVIVGFIVSGFLSMASFCSAAEYLWTQKADMPTPRWLVSASAVNGKIYAIGGRTGQPDNVKFSTVEEYDPSNDTWTQKADMPTARSQLSTCAVDGKIYAIGGSSGGASAVEEYDPATDTWTKKADMPTPRRALATCVVNGKIYAIGGNAPGVLRGLTNVEEYDPVRNTWAIKAGIPTGVWGLRARAVRGKIYAFGGRPIGVAIRYVQEYDPATDTWTRRANMPVGTSSMGSVVLDDKIIVIGGWIHSNAFPYKAVQIYDPETDTWTMEADAPFLRSCCAASVANCRIYVIGGTDRPHPCPATSTVYELVISGPPPDFNGDGNVDIIDLEILIDNWGTNDPLCDIAPPPCGDGIVDVQDLVVLAEHLFQEVDDPTLVAHWKLDETEGDIAYDSAAVNDAVVIGSPLWLPTGGMVDGAILLDGVDDCVISDTVLNPAEKPFSVFAWIKGGSPGQVIISQAAGANYLMVDTEGNLMTELKCLGRTGVPLQSRAVITDGQWHRIGLVWDGSNRTLCVDGVVVAEDTQNGLGASGGGLYIGAGKDFAPSSFFAGLIDDIRIYNRAIRP